MKIQSKKSVFITGLGLILLTNAIALGGAAYNRGGEPDSVLRLTQRELQRDYDYMNADNSGLALTLRWRTLGTDASGTRDPISVNFIYGGAPPWLDQAKLATLGFSIPAKRPTGERHETNKEVLLVMEFNGPAYQEVKQRVRDYVSSVEADAQIYPQKFEQKLKDARQRLDREENESSRLFIVDAGLDVSALRAQYPDRTRYAIVAGQVRPEWHRDQQGKDALVGYITAVNVDSIHVPLQFRSAFPSRTTPRPQAAVAEMQITLAYGRRFEPWITAVDSK